MLAAVDEDADDEDDEDDDAEEENVALFDAFPSFLPLAPSSDVFPYTCEEEEEEEEEEEAEGSDDGGGGSMAGRLAGMPTPSTLSAIIATRVLPRRFELLPFPPSPIEVTEERSLEICWNASPDDDDDGDSNDDGSAASGPA